jgi:ribosomal protein S18 acetylase RimI-like enzyme
MILTNSQLPSLPELTLDCIELGDTDTLSALGDVWYRAYNSNGPPLPLSNAEACAVVFACAEQSLWRLAGRHDGRLVSMAFGVQARENDGAGAPIPGHVLIRLVAVDAPFRNRGFGRRTVNGLLGLARESGFSVAQLWVATSSIPAQQLYERLGFRVSGRRKLGDRGELISHLTATLESA